ncbi:CRISPR locus-related DNA-binding protein [Candidatus Micrarchaeota archaeon]|nr:CRISPR locus-related DNA-binding protein [Candidatus Micrarchaeota archaeon]
MTDGENKLTEPLTLISSFYSLESVMPAIHQLSPNKLILVIHGGETDDKAKLTVKENIEMLSATHGKVMKIEVEKADAYDVLATASKITSFIESERKAGSRVIINITGGRKILGLGLLFGAYARSDQVERVVYGADFDPKLVDLPKMSFNVGNTKVKILEKLTGKEKLTVPELAEKIDITPAMAYVHLRELKSQGYVNENYEITTAGRLALL